MSEELLEDEFSLDLRIDHTTVSTSSAAATNNGGCETSRTSLCTDTLSTCC
ncbi:hypothetical protein [Streptomonospora wellingtoniae]|uniref:Thiazolylpeptide-type bacteriocin n=1 Tax=Streptomonospora wellingtoniae TaxID=3075544 RepID=A0ABU2KMX9_9ACTN|nr:hypothetical protein [Streptomonospora sp. DSM 45055]MDT0300620.1 hypothetical protein [Streptomonospora sp. DSM 45055]